MTDVDDDPDDDESEILTILFTDIVASTRRASMSGDAGGLASLTPTRTPRSILDETRGQLHQENRGWLAGSI